MRLFDRMRLSRLLVLVALALATRPALAADEPARPRAAHFDDEVRPFLARYCKECHGPQKPKGKFQVDLLTADFADRANRERWETLARRVQAREMPPEAKPRPSEEESRALCEWIALKTKAADDRRQKIEGRVALRRLNRVEYENTIRDLLAIDAELQDFLPPDSSANGFDNNSEAQHVSSFLMERYLDAANAALDLAIANLPQPKLLKLRLSCKEERLVKNNEERVNRLLDDGVVFFCSSPWQALTLAQFYPPDRGRYRFRISAYGFQSAARPVAFCLEAGPMLMGTKNHLVGYFDAPPEKAAVIEIVDHLEARGTIRILPYGLAPSQVVHKIGADAYDGPGLAIEWIDVEGPLHDQWPPESHRRIFGDLVQAPALTSNRPERVEVVSDDPEHDGERILREFARRAFRHPVTNEDVKPFTALFKARLAERSTFEQAIRVGLAAVLVSPQFLYLREGPGRLDDFALASRLSYFLWSTMPDDELYRAAERRELSLPEALHRQVERMLASPRAEAFVRNFVGQWLGLRDIDFTEPSHILYPEFDHLLKVSMVRECELFFAELLKNDLSIANFAASDFTMLNGRLAKHYAIGGVEGWKFRKCSLPPESHRGGVLTMAGVLKVTANGTTTSPVTRGAWVLEKILGTPPPRPPANVPALDPDIRGATTIREQLAKHREIPTCAACHAQIDPPGFALESFDVIGGWRDHYRTTGFGEEVMLAGRRMPYLKGPPVDAAGVLPDGRRFTGIDEFKQLLLGDKDRLARSLAEKLMTYATGAAPGARDESEIAAIVGRVREKNYGLRSLIHEIISSRLFRDK
jgi:hypothetical protein